MALVVGNGPQVILMCSLRGELLPLGIWTSSRPGEAGRGSSLWSTHSYVPTPSFQGEVTLAWAARHHKANLEQEAPQDPLSHQK